MPFLLARRITCTEFLQEDIKIIQQWQSTASPNQFFVVNFYKSNTEDSESLKSLFCDVLVDTNAGTIHFVGLLNHSVFLTPSIPASPTSSPKTISPS